jgi:hypothetical protein
MRRNRRITNEPQYLTTKDTKEHENYGTPEDFSHYDLAESTHAATISSTRKQPFFNREKRERRKKNKFFALFASFAVSSFGCGFAAPGPFVLFVVQWFSVFFCFSLFGDFE